MSIIRRPDTTIVKSSSDPVQLADTNNCTGLLSLVIIKLPPTEKPKS